MKTKIAIAQIDSVLGVVEKNIVRHLKFVLEAIKSKCDLIVFPELSLTGYILKDLVYSNALSEKNLTLLNPLVKLSKKISIIVGGVYEEKNSGIYNAAFLIENGKIKLVHKKIYLPTYGMFEEGRYFSAGNELKSFKTKKSGVVGVLICEDSWHGSLANLLAHQNSQIIISMTASPIRLSNKVNFENIGIVNKEIQKSIARLNSVFAVFVNRVGVEDGVQFYGNSHVVSPNGEMLSEANILEEKLLIADLDFNQIKNIRQKSRHFLDDSLLITNKLINDILNLKG